MCTAMIVFTIVMLVIKRASRVMFIALIGTGLALIVLELESSSSPGIPRKTSFAGNFSSRKSSTIQPTPKDSRKFSIRSSH